MGFHYILNPPRNFCNLVWSTFVSDSGYIHFKTSACSDNKTFTYQPNANRTFYSTFCSSLNCLLFFIRVSAQKYHFHSVVQLLNDFYDSQPFFVASYLNFQCPLVSNRQ